MLYSTLFGNFTFKAG